MYNNAKYEPADLKARNNGVLVLSDDWLEFVSLTVS